MFNLKRCFYNKKKLGTVEVYATHQENYHGQEKCDPPPSLKKKIYFLHFFIVMQTSYIQQGYFHAEPTRIWHDPTSYLIITGTVRYNLTNCSLWRSYFLMHCVPCQEIVVLVCSCWQKFSGCSLRRGTLRAQLFLCKRRLRACYNFFFFLTKCTFTQL